MFSVFMPPDVRAVLQQEILGSFKDLFVGFGSLAIFGIAHLVDDSTELGNDMKQVEDDFDMGDFGLDRQDIGVPHIHHNGLQFLFLLFAHADKEFFQRTGFAIFAHPDHSPGQVVQHYGQIAVAFSDGDLVNRQNAESIVVGLAIIFFQEKLIDRFDRFPIQPQMLGHVLDRHELAELVNVTSQPFGYPEVRIEKVEVFDKGPLTFETDNLSVLAPNPDSGRSKVQISDQSPLVAVDVGSLAATDMANGLKSFVGNGLDPSSFGVGPNPLLNNSDSWKREIVCYTQTGHRWPPLDNFLVGKQVYYPLEIPDVHFSFVA